MTLDDATNERSDAWARLQLVMRIGDATDGAEGSRGTLRVRMTSLSAAGELERHVAHLESLRILRVARSQEELTLMLAPRARRIVTTDGAAARAWRSVASHAITHRALATCQALLDVLSGRDPFES